MDFYCMIFGEIISAAILTWNLFGFAMQERYKKLYSCFSP